MPILVIMGMAEGPLGMTILPRERYGQFAAAQSMLRMVFAGILGSMLAGWLMRTLKAKRRNFGNIAGFVKNTNDLGSVAEWTASQFDASLNWKDLDWIRSIWPGKIVIKGIHDIEDAREAVKVGAQAMVVSNHGGRQLDGAPSSISVLREIVAAIRAVMRGQSYLSPAVTGAGGICASEHFTLLGSLSVFSAICGQRAAAAAYNAGKRTVRWKRNTGTSSVW